MSKLPSLKPALLIGLVVLGVFCLAIASTGKFWLGFPSKSIRYQRSSASKSTPGSTAPGSVAGRLPIGRSFAKLPLAFEPNVGQTDESVKFVSRGNGYALFLSPTEADMVLNKLTHAGNNRLETGVPHGPIGQPPPIALRMKLEGANRQSVMTGIDRLPGISNYFIANDHSKWRTSVPNFAKVESRSVYHGIDLVFYGNQRQLEYDLIVAPKTNPNVIRLRFEGINQLDLDAHGDAVLRLQNAQVLLRKPIIYQEVNGKKVMVDGTYRKMGATGLRLKLAAYDSRKPLIIDPVLTYSTFLGGSGFDLGQAIAVDPLGSAYVTGYTCSGNFPVAGSSPFPHPIGGCDAFVTKFNPAGTRLVYSTYLGGSAFDQGGGIAVDTAGSVYLTGTTFSTDFPVTIGAPLTGVEDAFVAKLSPSGSTLEYARTLGGTHPVPGLPGYADGRGVAIPQGCTGNCNAYVTGQTTLLDLPTTGGAFQPGAPNSFNAYVTEFSADGTRLVYSSYFGAMPGPNDDGQATTGQGIAVDASGDAYFTGQVDEVGLPITVDTSYHGGGSDCFVAEFNPSGSGLIYATYLGGSSHEQCQAIAIDPGCTSACSAYLTGFTWSLDFPTTAGAPQPASGGGQDAFVTKLGPVGTIVYSTYLGGIENEIGESIAVDGTGAAFVTGFTIFTDFPQVNSLFGPAPGHAYLFESTDGGTNFTPSGFPSTTSAVLTTSIDPSNPQTILTGTIRDGILRSTNGGASFSPTLIVGRPGGGVFDPNSPNIAYAETPTQLLKSVDGGISFQPTAFSEPVYSFAFDSSTTPSNFYVGNGVGKVFRSTDGAATFTQIPGLPFAEILRLAVDPNDPSEVYAGTGAGLYRSTVFHPTGSMASPRFAMASVLLNNGKALISGGSSFDIGTNWFSSAELYDPAVGSFSATGSMTVPRRFHTMTLLNDGRVLVAGGCTVGDASLNSAELYFPISGTFSSTAGSMGAARCSHSATLLADGRVLVAGGDPGGTAEIYDPTTDLFTPTGNMTQARSGHTATLLPGGRVLIAGGAVTGVPTASAEVFNPTTAGAVAGVPTATAEVFNPTTATFSSTGSMAVARSSTPAVLLSSGKVLIEGGSPDFTDAHAVTDAELYDPTVGTFAPTGNLNLPRQGHTAALLPGGSVLIVGGTRGAVSPDPGVTAELYDPVAGRFQLARFLGKRRVGAATVPLPNGDVLIAGGNNGPGIPAESSAELYQPGLPVFQRTNLHFSPIFSLAVDPTSVPSTVYAGTQFQGFGISNDGFNSFSLAEFPISAGVGFFSLAVDVSTTPGTLYAGNTNGQLLRSTDRGKHFTISVPAGGKPGNLNVIAINPQNPSNIFTGVFDELDGFVTRLNPLGTGYLFSTYLGGSQFDVPLGIAVDPSGAAAYVAGFTDSPDLPLSNPIQRTIGGPATVFVAEIGTPTPTPTPTPIVGCMATVPVPVTPTGGPGSTVTTGTLQVSDTCGSGEKAISSVTIAFDNADLFTSTLLTGEAGGVTETSPFKPALDFGAITTTSIDYKFVPPLVVPKGGTATFSLAVTITTTPQMTMRGAHVVYAGLFSLVAGRGSLGLGTLAGALMLLNLCSATIGGSRRLTLIALIVLMLALASQVGCDNGSVPTGGPITSTQTAMGVAANQNGVPLEIGGLPAVLGTVSVQQ